MPMRNYKYHDVTIAIHDAASYIPCLESHKNLSLTAIPLKISQINLKITLIQIKEKETF